MNFKIKQNKPVKTTTCRNGKTIRLPYSSWYGNTHISDHRTRQGALDQMALHRRLAAEKRLDDIILSKELDYLS